MGIDRSENMRRIRGKDTVPEMIVRRLVHAMGFRYRIHRRDIPGIPDLSFLGRRKLIFVHGCFWHQHPGCVDGHLPKTNASYWVPKLERNQTRDKETLKRLTALGWEVLIVWECETKDLSSLENKIRSFLE